MTRLELDRAQILAFRRGVSALDERLPFSEEALRTAAWAGLTDSMPRAALLSLHARVEGVESSTWEHPSLVQVWGPRFSVYVVPALDVAPFTLGRLDEPGRSRRQAFDIAERVAAYLDGRRATDREVGGRLEIGNGIRYAAPTGTLLIRWEGARAPQVWTVPGPEVEPHEARLELVRRFLHVFGPSTAEAFAKWAGISAASGVGAFADLAGELVAVRTPIGQAWMLASDEEAARAPAGPTAPARLLPSGDTYYLLWGTDRELLVPDAAQRAELWTTRVWPGALLVSGEVVGTWRRAGARVEVDAWRSLSPSERDAVEAEAASLPLPGLQGRISVRWTEGRSVQAERSSGSSSEAAAGIDGRARSTT